MQMFMQDLKYSLVFVGLVALLGLCADRAYAQVPVQPTYTRPSKGAPLTLINAAQGAPAVVSPVYDWTAFTATTVTLKFAKADGSACDCPTGVGTCKYSWSFQIRGSTAKTGPFFIIESLGLSQGLQNVASEDGFADLLFNIGTPYVQFTTQAIDYLDSGKNPVADACYMNMTTTPIPFTYRSAVEGSWSGGSLIPKNDAPVMSGGMDYVPSPASSSFYTPRSMRVNTEGVLATGPGSGAPILPATSPISVAASPAAATLIYTAVVAQRGVTLQNVGVWPVACAAGTNASSVSLTRYSFVLAAGSTAGDGTGGSYTVDQLPTSSGNNTVYCIGKGGAGSVAIMPQ